MQENRLKNHDLAVISVGNKAFAEITVSGSPEARAAYADFLHSDFFMLYVLTEVGDHALDTVSVCLPVSMRSRIYMMPVFHKKVISALEEIVPGAKDWFYPVILTKEEGDITKVHTACGDNELLQQVLALMERKTQDIPVTLHIKKEGHVSFRMDIHSNEYRMITAALRRDDPDLIVIPHLQDVITGLF